MITNLFKNFTKKICNGCKNILKNFDRKKWLIVCIYFIQSIYRTIITNFYETVKIYCIKYVHISYMISNNC